MAWTTVKLEVTTPLFNGGATSDPELRLRQEEPGIRVASIRGAMRFWFRALAGSHTGPDLALLASMERQVFGGLAGGSGAGAADGASAKDEHATPSPLLLRIPARPKLSPAEAKRGWLPRSGAEKDPQKWIVYLMGQGLGDLQSGTLHRACVEPGETFDLKIGFRHPPGQDPEASMAAETLALASLWLTCAYGGIGSRTRRGFGGLRIVDVDGPLPEPWQDPATLLTPDLSRDEHLARLWPGCPLGDCRQSLQTLAPGRDLDRAVGWSAEPSFPVLSVSHARAELGKQVYASWVQALSDAGKELRNFRANSDNPKAKYDPPRESIEWKTAIHGSETSYPVGGLGLPVVYSKELAVNLNKPDDTPARRSSPLWLRPVGSGRRWRLLSFAFHAEFLAPPAKVRIWRRGKEDPTKDLVVANADVKRVTDQWIDQLSAGGTFTKDERRV